MKTPVESLLWGVVAFAVLAWIAFAWTSCTGLTFATRSSRGRMATAQDVTRAKQTAVMATVIALPLAYFLMTRRR